MLKRVLMLICAAIIVATAVGAKKAHATPFCDHIYEYSFAVMLGKQYGLPMERAIVAMDNGNPIPEFRSQYIVIIRDAYQKQVYASDTMKEAAINQFAADWYFLCMEN